MVHLFLARCRDDGCGCGTLLALGRGWFGIESDVHLQSIWGKCLQKSIDAAKNDGAIDASARSEFCIHGASYLRSGPVCIGNVLKIQSYVALFHAGIGVFDVGIDRIQGVLE
jgi:hypothetical protein